MDLALSILDASGHPLAATRGRDDLVLVHHAPYGEGDSILVEAAEPGSFIALALDETQPESIVFFRDANARFAIPTAGDRKAYAPNAFAGDLHRLKARFARRDEIAARRNLALNPFDSSAATGVFPHGHANVVTRGEAAFAARNAIDGETANSRHGFWPYTSWGINQDPDAALTIEFGRKVVIDEVVLYLRADFPHDAWWQEATLSFSSGYSFRPRLCKTAGPQRFGIQPTVAEWARLHDLIKADDPSPFPALTQIELWGHEGGW